MNDTSPKIAVISTRMPYVDRRSLSEAWFSALHLASDGKRLPTVRDRRNLPMAGAAPARARSESRPPDRAPTARMQTQPRAPRTEAARGDLDVTTRRAYDARAAAIARASYERARSYPPFQTTLTLEAKGERVQLVLRREGATLHVVALCRPEIAETVRRALACADTHVRLRGEAIRSSVHVVSPSVVIA